MVLVFRNDFQGRGFFYFTGLQHPVLGYGGPVLDLHLAADLPTDPLVVVVEFFGIQGRPVFPFKKIDYLKFIFRLSLSREFILFVLFII